MLHNSQNLRILFIGTPEFSVPILETLIHDGYQIIGIVTKPDEPVGRKQILTPPPVKQRIMNYESRITDEIIIFQPEKLKDENFINQIKNLTPDLIIIAAYGKIIPKVILDIPRYGAVNIHGSLLPLWRGASPIQYAILNGDEETGVTIMLVDEEMDHGKIISSLKIQISKMDTYGSLSKKLSVLGAELLVKTIPGYISGEIKPQEQDHSKATYTKIIKKEDGKIDWSKNATEIERMTRAFYPWPTAYTYLKPQNSNLKTATQISKILKILEAGVLNILRYVDVSKYVAGEVFLADSDLGVKCGKGVLIIKKLQLGGRKVLTAREFLNGHKDFVGSILE